MLKDKTHFRFHLPHIHLHSPFGDDGFAIVAEKFARFFGTPVFLIIQTLFVLLWMCLNIFGYATFDLYPFILLNLAFSTQAAYAAPLILLAQTRQADRDKAHAEADAQHREDLAMAAAQRQQIASEQTELLVKMLDENNKLTKKIEKLTKELHTFTLKGIDK